MLITKKNKQLIRVALIINLLLLLLGITFLLFLGRDHSNRHETTHKIIAFTISDILCWTINILLLIFFSPVVGRRKNLRFISFYIPSFLVTFTVALIVAHSPALALFSAEAKLSSPIFAPLFFIASINTLSIVSIELILSKFDESNIKLEYATMKTENAELKMKSLEAQHEKLKSQLHPHFLFNSLNALNSLIRRDPELAENYLVKLSEFLRFSISHNEQNVVSLKEELKFSLYYLEMQKIRFNGALSYSVSIPVEPQTHTRLPVFSLQLILENAIKHNKFTYEQPLYITMQYIEPDWLLIENNVHEKLTGVPGSGRGLKNLSDRYMLLIQEDIKVSNDHDFFRVHLKLIRE